MTVNVRRNNLDGTGKSPNLKSAFSEDWVLFPHVCTFNLMFFRREERGDHLGADRCRTVECIHAHGYRLEVLDDSCLSADYLWCCTFGRRSTTGLHTELLWANSTFATDQRIRTQVEKWTPFECQSRQIDSVTTDDLFEPASILSFYLCRFTERRRLVFDELIDQRLSQVMQSLFSGSRWRVELISSLVGFSNDRWDSSTHS